MAVGAGLLAGLALPPLGLPPLMWLALAVLWQLVASGQRRLIVAWTLAALLSSHSWLLWLHPLDWIGVPAPLSLPLCLLIWLFCGAAAALLVLAWSLPWRRLGVERLDTALIAAAVWGLAEVVLARGPLFWIGLGVSPLPGDRALAGWASLGGAGLVAAIQLLIGWWIWRLLFVRQHWRRNLAVGGLLLATLHLLGYAALPADDREAGAGARLESVLVVQPAIPTRRKFMPLEQQRLLSQLAASLDGLAGAPVPLAAVLLPEGALPLDQPLPGPAPVEVLSGGFRRQGDELRSSLLRFEPGDRWPQAAIDKHRLVPLGEWVPLAGLARWSGLSAVGGLESGPASRLLPRPGGPIAVAICYELADGQALARATRDGAQWLLASANLDPYPVALQRQFSAVAQLRAIETGRWLVSAANTGPSLVIDPAGRPRGGLPLGQPAQGRLQLMSRQQPSGYDRWGEQPLLAWLIAALVWRLSSGRRRQAPESGNAPPAVSTGTGDSDAGSPGRAGLD